MEDFTESIKKGKGTIVVCPSNLQDLLIKVIDILQIPCQDMDITIHASRDEASTIDYHIYNVRTK